VRAANLSGFELVIEGVARSEPGLKAVLVVAAQTKDDHGCNKNKVVPGTGYMDYLTYLETRVVTGLSAVWEGADYHGTTTVHKLYRGQ
jgi:hypothetical protein